MDWRDAINLIAAGEDVEHVLDMKSAADRARFDRFLRAELGRPDLADQIAAKLREIDSGIDGARMCWHSISAAQRRVLQAAASGRRLVRRHVKPSWYILDGDGAKVAGVPTIRALCAYELLAWDGGAFDPEKIAVITERGRFVVKWGPTGEKP